jgi:hypothetical protein
MVLGPVLPPTWPPADLETEAAIGRFVIACGLLEGEVDEAIAEILGLEQTVANAVTANLGTKSKVEIFLSAFHHESTFFPPSLLEEVNKLGHDTATAAGVYRTWVNHGQPGHLNLSEDEGGNIQWIWSKASARKGGVSHSVSALTPDVFNNHTAAIKLLSIAGRKLEPRCEAASPFLIAYDSKIEALNPASSTSEISTWSRSSMEPVRNAGNPDSAKPAPGLNLQARPEAAKLPANSPKGASSNSASAVVRLSRSRGPLPTWQTRR